MPKKPLTPDEQLARPAALAWGVKAPAPSWLPVNDDPYLVEVSARAEEEYRAALARTLALARACRGRTWKPYSKASP
jgi:hypothetical protein